MGIDSPDIRGVYHINLMEPCHFGWFLMKVLHHIHDMGQHYPEISIFITKIDLGAAFWRLHVCTDRALLSTSINKQIAYFLGTLPFGTLEGSASTIFLVMYALKLLRKSPF